MRYRTLGRSELQVSEIGFGCWEFGGEYGPYEESEIVRAIHRALDLGVTVFDTARAYGFGRSEELLGKVLGRRRSEVVLVTKVGVERGRDGNDYRDSSRETLLRAVEDSLRFLRTDAVDLLLIHWPDRGRSWDEPMNTLVELIDKG